MTIPGRSIARSISVSLAIGMLLVGSVGSLAAAPQTPRVRVGGDIKAPKKIKDVPPVYPEAAKANGIQGTVFLETIIGTDGLVREMRVVRSTPMLDEAAMEAVGQWEYTPTLLNGEPVELIMTVSIIFTLQ